MLKEWKTHTSHASLLPRRNPAKPGRGLQERGSGLVVYEVKLCCAQPLGVSARHGSAGLNRVISHLIMASKATKAETHRSGVCKIIESDSHLLDLLSIATTDDKKAFFIQNLLAIAPTAFEGYDREPDKAFEMLTRWLGRYSHILNLFFTI
jgi:hypothetical protein